MSEILQAPHNTAAQVGQEARLNCRVFLDNDHVEWYTFAMGGTGERIFISNNPDEILVPGYSVEIIGDEQYNLVLESVENAQAGQYECRIVLKGEKAEAEFVSLCT